VRQKSSASEPRHPGGIIPLRCAAVPENLGEITAATSENIKITDMGIALQTL
jgi:hypothetical protein